MSLATKKMQERWEHDRQKRKGQGANASDKDDEMDMFSRSGACSRAKDTFESLLNDYMPGISHVVRKRITRPVVKLTKGVGRSVGLGKSLKAPRDSNEMGPPDDGVPRPSRSSSRRGLPTIAPAAPGLKETTTKDRDGDGDADSDDDLDFDENGFKHPSMYTNQPWIWLPKDEVGVSDRLVAEFRSAGVEASDVGAFMDMKGNVEVQRNPPDEDWAGGHDA